jgi:Ion channel
MSDSEQPDARVQIIIGKIPGKVERRSIPIGTTVEDAFSRMGIDIRGYDLRLNGRSVSPGHTIVDIATLLALRPIIGRARIAPWREIVSDLGYNLVWGSPVFLALLAWLFGSAAILQVTEGRPHYWDAVWVTWTTMTTMGWGNASLQTALGKLVISFDALAGLILIGCVVWLLSASLSRR